ncbi:hypothetical protein GCM10007939_09980 [Amylibacter marinus]|uniref:Heme exporter protein D n=1 Tax=Amylibacter marinus TaxID=1475483 RepID=A0ABQ5VTG1_9RHOB|nr:heme exporter protein CcmD [Amylibacter marinus]GLQ34715.1 hypothetical protein GCM10007939_09980 [Amylibacter marinus]
MIDLGKYSETVLVSYAVSILLLALLIWITFAQSKSAKKALLAEEARNAKANENA